MLKITLPDGSTNQVHEGSTVGEVAASIGKKLAKAAVAGRINHEQLVDLTYRLSADCSVEILTDRNPESLEILRHSTSHVMAAAVGRLFPDTRFAIGPAIASGFYYDFDIGRPFTEEDLGQIEAEMQKIIAADEPFVREEKDRQAYISELRAAGQVFKAELVENLADSAVSVYRTAAFTDLCRGPHLPSAGAVKAFKLLTIAGAYWRGDSTKPMLQRIYGTAFFSDKELADQLRRQEEAKARDHRRIGQDLDLFSFHEQGAGFPFWHPRGVVLYNEIVGFWKEVHRRHGYVEIKTPLILNEDLWHISGHWDNYKNNMYFTQIDEKVHAVKPMNCPGGLLIFANRLHSYKDLPMRVAELGTVHRHELSGVLHGLFRVRSFTQDDAHIFCVPSQVADEIAGVINLFREIYTAFGLADYRIELSTRPAKSIGSDADWEMAENALKQALDGLGITYQLNPGDGAFYGPKIDFHITDCMQRSWQCGTIQLDFSMPVRFAEAGLNIRYIDSDNTSKSPVMIHRACLGSLERFIGIVIEEYAGRFPLWLAPVQAVIATVTDSQHDYAAALARDLEQAGLRVQLDLRNEKLGYKVREAIMQKIPYVLVVGDKEVADATVTIRHRDIKDAGTFSRETIIEKLKAEYASRSLVSVFNCP